MKTSSFWADRLKASGIHLGLSLCIAALAAFLVFGVWYPYPYREISGGRELFFLVITVDVILGPLITLAIFNRAKPWALLRRDLAVVALLQLGALAYGLWTVSVSRPVHLVFEQDRFRVVHAIEVDPLLLLRAAADLPVMPWTGPTPLSLRDYINEKERTDVLFAELAGNPVGARPDFWQPYGLAKDDVLHKAQSVAALKARFPAKAAGIDSVLTDFGRDAGHTVYLPMVGRGQFWTAFLDPVTAQIVAYMPLDPF
ncbi:MAG: hypothetical protein RL682_1423 [Pseudomonadota bacterium]|jgi:hypothetical protein